MQASLSRQGLRSGFPLASPTKPIQRLTLRRISREKAGPQAAHAKSSMPLSQQQKSTLEGQLLERQQALLDSISAGDYSQYTALCAEDLTCFEPEAKSHLVTGLPFHKFYFDLGSQLRALNPPGVLRDLNTMSGASVRLLSDTSAVICYVRLRQTVKRSEKGHPFPDTVVSQETRVWQQFDPSLGIEGWKNVHLHRSNM